MHFRVAHVTHCDDIAALCITLKVWDGDCRQVDRQDLLNHVIIEDVHFQFCFRSIFFKRLLLLASFVLEHASKSKFALLEFLNVIIN